MIRHIRFEEAAYISRSCDGVVFSASDAVPLDYERPEEDVMKRLNRWIADNSAIKIISIQGPVRQAVGDHRSGVGRVSVTLLYED